jgi:hypothetical protein
MDADVSLELRRAARFKSSGLMIHGEHVILHAAATFELPYARGREWAGADLSLSPNSAGDTLLLEVDYRGVIDKVRKLQMAGRL